MSLKVFTHCSLLSTHCSPYAILQGVIGRSLGSKVIVALWVVGFIAFWVYVQRQDEGLLELFRGWLDFIRNGALGPLIFLLIYLIRPFLLVPITLLTVASGFLFGAPWGFAYALFATLLSTAFTYLFGRYVAGDVPGLGAAFIERLRTRAFETVLISRFIFLPGGLGQLRRRGAAHLICGFYAGDTDWRGAGAAHRGVGGGVARGGIHYPWGSAQRLVSAGVGGIVGLEPHPVLLLAPPSAIVHSVVISTRRSANAKNLIFYAQLGEKLRST